MEDHSTDSFDTRRGWDSYCATDISSHRIVEVDQVARTELNHQNHWIFEIVGIAQYPYWSYSA